MNLVQWQMNASKDELKEHYIKQQERLQHHYFAADFECTTQPPCLVYMATLQEVHTGQQWQFTNIRDFIDFFIDYPNSTVYFHNGSNYDFEFIINYILSNNTPYRIKTGKNFAVRRILPEIKCTKTGKLKQSKNKYQLIEMDITLRDSRDVVGGSIKGLGESIGLQKGMGEIETPLVAYINDDNWLEQLDGTGHHLKTHYGDFQKDMHRLGYWDYAIQDTYILAEVLKKYGVIEHANNGKYTQASIAYSEMLDNHKPYKDLLYQQNKFAKDNHKYREYAKALNRRAKRAFKGGAAWANDMFIDKDTGKAKLIKSHGFHIDYTSMYSSIYMNPELYPLPTREPVNYKTNLYIIHYTNLTADCKPNKFPLLKQRTDQIGYNNSHYLNHFNGNISLTTPENEYLFENYTNITYDKVEVEYYEEHHHLEQALKKHGEKWYAVKQNPDNPAQKAYAKLMLNTCYGYLGFFESPISTYEYKSVNGVTVKEKAKDGITGIDFAEVPAASFITAYGRCKLANDINKVGAENVVCCDTDSLFVINYDFEELSKLLPISNELGDLKLEHEFEQIKALKAKTWCIADENGNVIAQATAGSNYKFKHISSFNEGETIVSSQKYYVNGGIQIKDKPKKFGSMDDKQLFQNK